MSVLLTEIELCEFLKVSRVFVYRCRQGGMPYLKVGNRNIRYDLDVTLDWFKQNTCIDKRSDCYE